MINPEFDKTPERHFSFTHDCQIKGRTDEGEETINICQLNRKDLIRERLEVRQSYVSAIKIAFDDFHNKHQDKSELKGELKATFKKLKLGTDKSFVFSLFHMFMYTYFDYFIGKKLPDTIRPLAIKYFNEYKSI